MYTMYVCMYVCMYVVMCESVCYGTTMKIRSNYHILYLLYIFSANRHRKVVVFSQVFPTGRSKGNG